MVVGWSMPDRIDSNLVISTHDMGLKRRGICSPRIVHSAQGSQYASQVFRDCIDKSCVQSMSRKSSCWDNAVAESFFGTIKSESLYRHKFKSRKEAQLTIFEFIEIFYNNQRLHSTLDYLTPEEMHLKGKKAT